MGICSAIAVALYIYIYIYIYIIISSVTSMYQAITALENPSPYFRIREPPLWSSGQTSWLQIQRSRLDSQNYQFF
jgi:hypothetical protein